MRFGHIAQALEKALDEQLLIRQISLKLYTPLYYRAPS